MFIYQRKRVSNGGTIVGVWFRVVCIVQIVLIGVWVAWKLNVCECISVWIHIGIAGLRCGAWIMGTGYAGVGARGVLMIRSGHDADSNPDTYIPRVRGRCL